jgi:hypothetical protein
MFQPSKSHLQGVRLIHFHGQINKMCNRREIQFNEQLILYYVAATYWSNTVLIKWCENYKDAWFGFIWNSDISARKWTRYSLMFRLFILRKLIHHYNQGLFCVPCRKSTHRTLNWKRILAANPIACLSPKIPESPQWMVTLPIPLR